MLSDDEQTTLFSLRRGQFFGEIALVLSERRTSSVAAATTCDMLTIRKRDLLPVLRAPVRAPGAR